VAPRARGGAPDQLGGPGPGLEGAGAEEGGRGGGRKPEAAAAPAPETWQALRVHPRDSLIWGGVAFSAWLNLQLCLRHQEGTDFPNHRHPSRFRGWGGEVLTRPPRLFGCGWRGVSGDPGTSWCDHWCTPWPGICRAPAPPAGPRCLWGGPGQPRSIVLQASGSRSARPPPPSPDPGSSSSLPPNAP
jgi:hypothetical protein